MRARSIAAAGFASAVLVLSGVSPAFAGEITGTGNPTPPHFYKAHSICSFSGLEDGGETGVFPGPGGAPPQNWGHDQQAARAEGATPADLKASGFQPGDSCNGHTGFIATGGGE